MMRRFLTILIIPVPFPVRVVCICFYCGPAEYETEQECCPVCAPGYYVHKHCTELTSTTCAPCPPSTYTDTQSGLTSCMSCAICDPSAGLRDRKVCSYTSDTLCEPLEGYFCIDPIKDGCRGAVEHTKCNPGQYVKQTGSAYSDTMCVDCGKNTYSDGSFRSCRPHAQCTPGTKKIKDGTSTTDTECQKNWLTIIIIISALVLILALIIAAVIHRKRSCTNPDNEKRRKENTRNNPREEIDPTKEPFRETIDTSIL